MKKVVCVVLVVFGFSQVAFAVPNQITAKLPKCGFDKEAFIESAREKKVLQIGLVDCIAYALRNNTEILIRKIEPKIRKDDLKIADAVFEPIINLNYNINDFRDYSTSSLFTGSTFTRTRTADFGGGLSGKLWTGTQYSVVIDNTYTKTPSRFSNYNRYYDTTGKATITQPLLKGFGILVNKADIYIAQNNLSISKESFRKDVMDVLTKTEVTYYSYILALEAYDIAKILLDQTESLLEINRKRYKVGQVSSVDLLETEAAYESRRKYVISADREVQRSEDELKLVTNIVDDPSLWNAEIDPLEKPEFDPKEVDLADSLDLAFKNRPDYASARFGVENTAINVERDKNGVLPQLDFTGSYAMNAYGKSYNEMLTSLGARPREWALGAKFSIPIFDSSPRALYSKSKFQNKQALIALNRLEQNIIFEVRDAVRQVNIQYRQVMASKKSVEAEEKNYSAQKERYAAGRVSTHDMLDYQEKFATAKLDYAKALVAYKDALIELDRIIGLTLEKKGIKIESMEA
ncbi:MAG: TolC family protein [Candidatus Omnitrophica bacterium]|nr:TolC family protein [Candidatus Omnitrophota bacterium]